jgi:hypothetical protein
MNRIDNILKQLIYKKLEFVVDGKVIRQGFVEIFNTKQNFIKFKIKVGEESKEWELTYPYKIDKNNDCLIFDYCLSAFVPRTEDAYWKMFMMNKSEASKLYNNYLYVRELSGT